MAFNVSYIFQARDQFSSVARKIKDQTKGLNKEFKALPRKIAASNPVLRRIASVGLASMKKLGRGVSAAVRKVRMMRIEFKRASSEAGSRFKQIAIAALGFFGAREFLRTGAQFQDSIADLSAITGSSGVQLSKFNDKILEMAKSSATAQDQVALAFTSIASLKSELLKSEGALETVTEQALLLANAAGIEIPDAVRASVGALNQFNQGADQASRFVNVIAAGAKIGASLVGETAEALKNAGAVASQFNVSFEETNALIQVLAKNEIKGAEAGTKLRGVLSKLEKIAKGKIAPSVIGITKSLELLEKAGLSNTQVIDEFGEENLSTILILRKNIPLFKQFTTQLKGTNVAQEQAKIRLSTFNAKMRVLGITIKDVLIRTFSKLEPTLTKITEEATKFIDSITPEQVETFAEGLKEFILASKEVIKQLSTKLIPLVKEFLESMDAKSVGGIVSNITSITDAVDLLLSPVKLVASLFKGVGTAIGEGAGQLATFNFQSKSATSFVDAFSIGGKFLGLFGGGGKAVAPIPKIAPITAVTTFAPSVTGGAVPSFLPVPNVAPIPTLAPIPAVAPSAPSLAGTAGSSFSRSDVNVNLRAPEGVVESVKTARSGNVRDMNLGVNMAMAGG